MVCLEALEIVHASTSKSSERGKWDSDAALEFAKLPTMVPFRLTHNRRVCSAPQKHATCEKSVKD